MNAANLEWRTAEPSAFGTPHYLSTFYNGIMAEVRFTGDGWKWMVYAGEGDDADLPTDEGREPTFHKAADAIRDSIGDV